MPQHAELDGRSAARAKQPHMKALSQLSQAVRLFGCSGCFSPPLSASACARSKRRRFGCRRTAKLRALTCGICLSGALQRATSYAARRYLLRAQVAPIAPLRGAVGDAGCRARFFAYFLLGRHTGRAARKLVARRGEFPASAQSADIPPLARTPPPPHPQLHAKTQAQKPAPPAYFNHFCASCCSTPRRASTSQVNCITRL